MVSRRVRRNAVNIMNKVNPVPPAEVCEYRYGSQNRPTHRHGTIWLEMRRQLQWYISIRSRRSPGWSVCVITSRQSLRWATRELTATQCNIKLVLDKLGLTHQLHLHRLQSRDKTHLLIHWPISERICP